MCREPKTNFLPATLGLAEATGRRRKATALFLALALGVFGLETAIHSVHHLSDISPSQNAAQCPVLSASQHVVGALGETSEICAPTLASEAPASVGTESILPARFFGSDQGRAPPSLLA